MKFSSETLDILDNFASINTQMLFRPGSAVSVKSGTGTCAAIAKIPETIDGEFAIHDLKKLLGVLSLFKDPEVTVGSSQLEISSSKQKIKYTYTDKEHIIIGPDPTSVPDLGKSLVDITLTPENFQNALKASAVLSTPEVAIVGDGSVVTITSFSKKDPTSDVYSLEIGETDKNFNIIFQKDSLKMLPLGYEVSIHKAPKVSVAKFKSEKVTYYVSLDKDSKFA